MTCLDIITIERNWRYSWNWKRVSKDPTQKQVRAFFGAGCIRRQTMEHECKKNMYWYFISRRQFTSALVLTSICMYRCRSRCWCRCFAFFRSERGTNALSQFGISACATVYMSWDALQRDTYCEWGMWSGATCSKCKCCNPLWFAQSQHG